MSTEKSSLAADAIAAQNPPPATATSERPPPRIWNSDDLLGAETEALIMHRGQTYRLRCTKQGKLILYK